MFKTLSRCTANYRSNSPPLAGHQFSQMKQLLLFITTPFSLTIDEGSVN